VIRAPFAAPRLNQALGATALVFAGIATWPWLVPPIPAVRAVASSPAQATAPALPALPPLASYAAIVERPLFSPSRRPAPGARTAPGPSIESRYRLVGIIAAGPKKKALVAEGARRVEIAEGDTLDGWTVTAIGKDRVTLTSPTGEAALKLAPAAEEAKKP
jgi:general secretion pathway protein N